MGPQDRDGVHDEIFEEDEEIPLEIDDEVDPEMWEEDKILDRWMGDDS